MRFCTIDITLLLFPISAILTLAPGVYAFESPPHDSCFSPILWEPCPGAPQAQCSSYKVPLDYAHAEVGNATLALARVKATKQPRLGTLFVNPGGPGGSGVQLVQSIADQIVIFTNGQYDLVGWDPRGVNQSTPKITCGFTSQEDIAQFFSGTIFDSNIGVEARGNLTDQDDLNNLFDTVSKTDEKVLQLGQKCVEGNGAFLKYMGTTAVVRDMVSISDCLEGQVTPVNYYGISYGTVIGSYFVNMFPERVGRVVLDGVADSIIWATEPSFKFFGSTLASAEAVFAGFTELCTEAGPQNCTIAKNSSTPASLSQDTRQLIDMAYTLHKNGKSNITAFEIRSFISDELASPTSWDAELVPQLASWTSMLDKASLGNPFNTSDVSPRNQVLKAQHSTTELAGAVDPVVQIQMSGIVVPCVDSIDQENVTTKRVLEELVHVTNEVSPMFGEVIAQMGQFNCHRFPVRAVERFMGPFNHTLVNPILIIGNKGDPVTPLANAQKIAAALGSSAHLLEQDGFGHTSFAENSDCTQGAVRNYFLNGKLPSKGQVCQTDQGLFPVNNTVIGGF